MNVKRPHLVIPDQTASRQTSTISSKSIDKVILFKKALGESLGLGIAGGLGSLFGDLPVFVLDIKPGGRVSCDGRIRKVRRSKVERVFPMVVNSILPRNTEFGPNDHPEDAPHLYAHF